MAAAGWMSDEELVEQHAESAVLTYYQRASALRAPHHTLDNLASLDQRIASHLAGLFTADAMAWEVCSEAMQVGEPEELFVAAALALHSRSAERVEQVLNQVERDAEGMEGVATALAWASTASLRSVVKALLCAESPARRYLGLSACVAHGVVPRELRAALADDATQVRARALRACGELGTVDMLGIVIDAIDDPDPLCRYWAAWSAVLLGDQRAAPGRLLDAAQALVPSQELGIETALAALPVPVATTLLGELGRDSQGLRAVTLGIGAVGDPQHVPWLILQMRVEPLARIAALAMSRVCGVSLARVALEQGGESSEEESGDEHDDIDEDLPWPSASKAEAWWADNRTRFVRGERYFVGCDVSKPHCLNVLLRGSLRHRSAAALHLSLMHPGSPLFDTVAPAWRQQRRLAQG